MITLPHARKLITKALRKVEDDSLSDGVDVTSVEFKDILKKVQSRLLEEMGIPEGEYEQYLESLREIGRTKAIKKKEQIIEELNDLKGKVMFKVPEWEDIPNKPHIPTDKEIIDIAHEIAEKYVQPPQITNEIVKETIVEMPSVVREEYDDTGLKEEILTLHNKVSKLPTTVDTKRLKREIMGEFKNSFAELFKQNINILGMPDFRKLAMGLQAQIDELAISINSILTNTVYRLTDQVDGVKTVFTLPAYTTGSVMVFYSSFPLILDPGVDFTESGNGEITLSFVPIAGQTLVATYKPK